MRILLGSRNKGKISEITKTLADLPLTILTPDEAGIAGDPEETAETYQDNAILKARFFHEASRLPTVSDDSGIIVDALAGELGVKTRRWGAGAAATDQEWIEFFLKRMADEENRRATFISTIAFIDAEGKHVIFEGRCEGQLMHELDGDYLPGLPLRSVFKPDGSDVVLSRMTFEQENAVNHRHKSVLKLRDYLSSILP